MGKLFKQEQINSTIRWITAKTMQFVSPNVSMVPQEFTGEIILLIGSHLPKLLWNIKRPIVF